MVEQFLVLMEGRIESVHVADVEDATRLADRYHEVGARDLLHTAVMRRLGTTRIVSADADFDRIAGVERLDLAEVDSWIASVGA